MNQRRLRRELMALAAAGSLVAGMLTVFGTATAGALTRTVDGAGERDSSDRGG